MRELLFGGPAAAAEGRSPGPTNKDIEALVKSDLGDEELTAQAEELGLDADAVRLMRRILDVTPENRSEVETEIKQAFGEGTFKGIAFSDILAVIAETDGQAGREKLITRLFAGAVKGRRGLLGELGTPIVAPRGGTRRPGIGRLPRKPKKGPGDPGKSEKGGTGGTPPATPNTVTSRLAEIPFAKRQAKKMGDVARREVDNLKRQLAKGNLNPGKGTRILGNDYLELRGQRGGRVIVKKLGKNRYEVVGEFQGHKLGDKANSDIINRLIESHKNLLKGSQR